MSQIHLICQSKNKVLCYVSSRLKTKSLVSDCDLADTTTGKNK